MLFADDVLLTSYCVADSQRQIDVLKHFADNFSMTVNTSKAKIVVFRKGGFLAANEVWRYGDKEVEVVNSYKYLGLYHQNYHIVISKTLSNDSIITIHNNQQPPPQQQLPSNDINEG